MVPVFPLRTERLLLRDFVREDLAAYAALQSHPLHQRYYSEEDAARSAELVEMFIAQAERRPRTKYQLAILLDDGSTHGTVIGSCGVRREHEGDDDASFGCELGTAYWGQGYALEAARAILAFGFAEPVVQRIHAVTITENTRAVALAERLGMRIVERRPRDQFFRGEWWGTTVLAVRREEWEERQK